MGSVGPVDSVVGEHLVGDDLHGLPVLAEVVRPRDAAVGQVDALEEAGDDLAELGQHQVGVGTGLGERMGGHPQQQGLVALPGPVDADVRERRCGQHPPYGIEGLGPDGLAVDEVGVVLASWGDARGSGPGGPGPGPSRCRTAGPCRPRSGRRGWTRGSRGRGGTGTVHRGARRRGCSGSTAPGRTSAVPTRAPWSTGWTPVRTPGGRHRAGRRCRRRTRRRRGRTGSRPARARSWRRSTRRRWCRARRRTRR